MHQNVSICQSLILSCLLPLAPNSKRNKIVFEELNFPSVMYVYEAHAREHGLRIETREIRRRHHDSARANARGDR